VVSVLAEFPVGNEPLEPLDLVALGRLTNRVIEGPVPVPAELGAQPSESEEVVSTALGGDWEFRGIRPPIRT
jgi:5-oxopent-3-ene-1,2,5-tricarboxylate decarboxylase/2-hydroxyhepta-2,4-diene-1,7-dioate isomerase